MGAKIRDNKSYNKDKALLLANGFEQSSSGYRPAYILLDHRYEAALAGTLPTEMPRVVRKGCRAAALYFNGSEYVPATRAFYVNNPTIKHPTIDITPSWYDPMPDQGFTDRGPARIKIACKGFDYQRYRSHDGIQLIDGTDRYATLTDAEYAFLSKNKSKYATFWAISQGVIFPCAFYKV